MSDSSEDESSSSSEYSLSDIERPGDFFRTELGENYEKVKAWLISKCHRHFILHKDRERKEAPSQQSLDFSWKWFKEDFLRSFPDLKEWLGDNRSDWGILGMWEDEVFQTWMILPEQYQNAVKNELGRRHGACADLLPHCNLRSKHDQLRVPTSREESPPKPSHILRDVEYEAQKKEDLTNLRLTFNMPAANDLVKYLIGRKAIAVGLRVVKCHVKNRRTRHCTSE